MSWAAAIAFSAVMIKFSADSWADLLVMIWLLMFSIWLVIAVFNVWISVWLVVIVDFAVARVMVVLVASPVVAVLDHNHLVAD